MEPRGQWNRTPDNDGRREDPDPATGGEASTGIEMRAFLSKRPYCFKTSGSLAMFAAMRRASSIVSPFTLSSRPFVSRA
jgi:hypothetical protein